MSGFYYKVHLVDLNLSTSQLNKIRDYIRESVREVAAIDSGEFLRSLSTKWNKGTQILTIGSTLYYSGFVEGGNKNYTHHKDKIKKALLGMGLNPSPILYY